MLVLRAVLLPVHVRLHLTIVKLLKLLARPVLALQGLELLPLRLEHLLSMLVQLGAINAAAAPLTNQAKLSGLLLILVLPDVCEGSHFGRRFCRRGIRRL